MSGDPPPNRCDVAVVGAGILGLAAARELARRRPGRRIAVLEKEDEVGFHQTGHSSGVVHAGIYYTPGSLKSRLCTTGARELYEYCDQRRIPHERCGKVIVATTEQELPGLDELERRGRANGVPGLRRLDPARLEEVEPHARGVAALHSPGTGIADFPAIARSFAQDVRGAGGTVTTGTSVEAVREGRGEVAVEHSAGTTVARAALVCAGAWSDRLAVAAGAPADPRIVPFRGAYLRLRAERRELVRGLIYPVPDPELPFLGVHLTRHVDGDVLVGPTALLAAARDAYRMLTIAPSDIASTLTWPGTYRMARRFWRTGLGELRHLLPMGTFVAEAARYVPELRSGDVLPGPAGVRAQAVGRDGRLVDDFVFSHSERALHVR